ncbi:L-lysine 2,3-aminomutase [Pseudidiomarina piscicola]|uniref:L-lysine 2,3-aminomutase n=1 Tax=Pseudidiomarina piscicola TaxID=2614830 RepID=A0A6S6WNV7_9GAMM|nr:EF-P beta-lysylation protein EpmB [Pseudidiomarina piscicola]CAB0151793.1 L-lysine 2,3-aminomutase [Pseudidiomarina piscicola]VZT41245.1 L-lysine 2,3-aminomutase [Pseudomonas aeruginosa]
MTEAATIAVRPAWQQALAQAIRAPEQLAEHLNLPHSWVQQHGAARELFPLMVTRHFANLMTPGDIDDPLLRQVMPHLDEYQETEGFTTDPLEEQNAQQPSLLHKYRSRVLVIMRSGCAINCRYCFRRHFPYADHHFGPQQRAQLLAYLQRDPAINEVIVSGGDPLLATDKQFSQLLDELEQLPQLKRIRIHSRLPVVLPERLTHELAERLARSRLQAVLVIHANHPQEIAPQLQQRLIHWADAGITLLNQSVLLRQVNNNADVLAELSERLFAARVLPYYLHMLDKVKGASHFAVTDAEACALAAQLRAQLPGFLVPRLVREVAGEPSKTPLELTMSD